MGEMEELRRDREPLCALEEYPLTFLVSFWCIHEVSAGICYFACIQEILIDQVKKITL